MRILDYSGIVNFLDYTSGSFPVTFADRSLDLEMPNYVPMGQADEINWQACECKAVNMQRGLLRDVNRSERFIRWRSCRPTSHG